MTKQVGPRNKAEEIAICGTATGWCRLGYHTGWKAGRTGLTLPNDEACLPDLRALPQLLHKRIDALRELLARPGRLYRERHVRGRVVTEVKHLHEGLQISVVAQRELICLDSKSSWLEQVVVRMVKGTTPAQRCHQSS